MFHWEGGAAAAKASEKFGTLYGLWSLATTGIEEIGNIHSGPKVFQLYVWKDRELVKDVIAKAKEGGFGALALTVDFTWYLTGSKIFTTAFPFLPSIPFPK